LPFIYKSVEVYTDFVELSAGKEYTFSLETENYTSGALRVLLNWKTPSIFANEKIIEHKEQTRTVYLPSDNQWYDFWTGDTMSGGQTVTSAAPIDKIPLLVKAGSIIPMGPFVQYAAENPSAPIELRVYPGANGCFTFYEDENDNYNYEKGIFSTILFSWNDATRQFTIGKRQGTFPGMLEKRIFHIILVTKNHGNGVGSAGTPDKILPYQGEEQVIQF
jgi:alpha-D-xyloside xylohydrolase